MNERTLTEEEIIKLKRNSKVAAIAQWLILLFLIIFFIYLNYRVEGLDGAKCITNPCNYCMDKFDDVICITNFGGNNKLNYGNFTELGG